MAKIALLATNLAGSGAEKIVLNLARMFKSHRDEVHIFLLENVISYDTDGLTIHTLSQRRDIYKGLKGLGDRILAYKLKKKMRTLINNESDFDLVLSNLPSADRVATVAQLPNTYYLIHTSYSMELEEFRKRGKYIRAKKKEKLYRSLYHAKNLIKLLCNSSSELKALIHKFGIEEKVEILGFKKNPYPIIKGAKALLLSSEREGLPTVLIEALILGTPIVSTNCKSGPDEILVDRLSGYLAKVNDSDDLAKKIQKLLDEKPEIKKCYIEKFDADEVYKQYLTLLS